MNKKRVFLVLKIVFVVLMIIGANGLFMWHNDKKVIRELEDSLRDYLREDEDGYYVDDMDWLNPDYRAWIKIEDTNINYPVLQRDSDNYYLTHDFYGDKNSAGWIFMGAHNSFKDDNIVIYGHHRRDNIMFGDIDKLFKKKYYDNNDGKILLIVNDQEIYYQIFSVYEASSDDYYNSSNFKDFKKAIKEFEERSEIDFDEDLDNVEQILTLSTCHNNNRDRLVVQAYRIN